MSSSEFNIQFPTADGSPDAALPDFADKTLTHTGHLPDFMAQLAFGKTLEDTPDNTGEK